MGVIYKLKEEVVHFIISQRQNNPLASCRELAESASQKFNLHLSKSSVHDVLKESGIITPRGRKPRIKFEIPQEKKKLIALPPEPESKINLIADVVESKAPVQAVPAEEVIVLPPKADAEVSAEYEGAGKVFLKAVFWDLGIFSEDNIKETDWEYYLTYSKGIKVILENNRDFFISLPLPLERCIREATDGLVNNVKPFILYKVSDEELFKSCMEAKTGFKINSVSIVDERDHVLLEFDNIMELNRTFMTKNRIFVENKETNPVERSKSVFFSQIADNVDFTKIVLDLKGFDTTNQDEKVVTLLIDSTYDNKAMLQAAAERLNEMYLRDEQDKLVKVVIHSPQEAGSVH
jgi:hypothetical protein